MVREAIAKGVSVSEAFLSACKALGVEPNEAKYEVLESPQKKTFGLFGGRPAKVRVYIEIPDEPVKEEAKPQQTLKRYERPAKAKAQEPVKAEEKPAETTAAPAAVNEGPGRCAAEYIRKILNEMGIEATVDISFEGNGAALKLSGENIGFVIGHRGETLDSLQYLASLVANHVEESYYRITLDVGDYREKRRQTLEGLGKRMALRAIKTGRNQSLEPMNPYERRLIHTAVQEINGAKSWSEGMDQNRHVVIGPIDGERYRRGDRRGSSGRGGYNNRQNSGRGYDRRNSGYQNRQSESQAPRAAGPKLDDPSAPIYGKIEVKK